MQFALDAFRRLLKNYGRTDLVRKALKRVRDREDVQCYVRNLLGSLSLPLC